MPIRAFSIQVVVLASLAQLLGLVELARFARSIHVDRKEKCLDVFCMERFACSLLVVLLTEPNGGSFTFRPQLCVENCLCYCGEKMHSMCVHHVLLVAKALCTPVAV